MVTKVDQFAGIHSTKDENEYNRLDNNITEDGQNPVPASTIYKVITDNEKVIAAALSELNARVTALEG